MKISIDGSNLYGNRTGVGRYLSNILNFWYLDKDKKLEIFYKNELSNDPFSSCQNIHHYAIKDHFPYKHQLWNNMYLYSALNKSNSDIYFTSNYTLPMRRLRQRKVVTIFDISYITNPEWFPFDQRTALKVATNYTMRHADKILTGSMATKNAILDRYEFSPDNISVIPLGFDQKLRHTFLSKEQKSKLKDKYKLRTKVVLFVGLILNRRNIDITIKAIARLKHQLDDDVSFLLVGKDHSYPKLDLKKIASDEGVADNFVWLKYVDDDTLSRLYGLSDLFMCGSTVEGFNITPLEAMNFDLPVIASRSSSLPEVLGDAAYYIEDPSDVEQQAHAIFKLLNDDALAKQMIKVGIIQREKFSWKRCASETYDAIVDW